MRIEQTTRPGQKSTTIGPQIAADRPEKKNRRGALPEFKIHLSCRLNPALVDEPSIIGYGSFATLRRQAADALRRARKLPVGPHRNDLRQLAIGLRWLEKQRLRAAVRRPTGHERFAKLGRLSCGTLFSTSGFRASIYRAAMREALFRSMSGVRLLLAPRKPLMVAAWSVDSPVHAVPRSNDGPFKQNAKTIPSAMAFYSAHWLSLHSAITRTISVSIMFRGSPQRHPSQRHKLQGRHRLRSSAADEDAAANTVDISVPQRVRPIRVNGQ